MLPRSRFQCSFTYGGMCNNVKGKGGNGHHLPRQAAFGGDSDGTGLAMKLTAKDHRKSFSYGGSEWYQAKQKSYIRQGRFWHAFAMDVEEVLSKYGAKYAVAMWELVECIGLL